MFEMKWYRVSRYQAIDFSQFMSDWYEPYTNSFANDWVKGSSVDSAAEEVVKFEVEEYRGLMGFVNGVADWDQLRAPALLSEWAGWYLMDFLDDNIPAMDSSK